MACQQARELWSTGDAPGAQAALAQAHAAAARCGRGWLEVGRVQVMLDPEGAVATLREATRQPAEAAEAWSRLGRHLWHLDRPSEAVVALSAALWTAPTDEACRRVLAQALVKLGRWREAQGEILHLLAHHPGDLDLWRLRVTVAEHLPEVEERVATLSSALAIFPLEIEWIRALVSALDQAGRSQEATERLTQAAGHTPLLGVDLGRRLSLAGDPRAQSVLERVVAHPECPAEAFYLLGRLEQLAGQHAPASAHFSRALDLGLRSPEVYCGAAWSLHEQGDVTGALHLGVQGLMAHRGDARLTTLLNQLQERMAGRSSPPPLEASASMAGGLDCVAVAELLEFLRLNRRTGTLRLNSPRGVAQLQMVGGELVNLSSSNVPRLGDALIARGLLTRAQVEPLLTSTDELLGVRLIDRHLISPEALRGALYDQATTAMTDLIGWTEGQFSFSADEGLRARIRPGFELNTTQVVLDAMRWLDERSVS